MNSASVSVIVSTYTTKRLSDVVLCLASLKKQTLQPTEVILVLDPVDELVEFYKTHVPLGTKIVVSDGFGLSCARNAGVKSTTGDIVAFIDDDAVADEKWLENSILNYKDEHVVGVGGQIWPTWERNRPAWFPEELYWIVGCSYKGLPQKRASIRNPIGCNMSFRKTVLEKAGYFRKDIGRLGCKLMCNEETEFAIRALKMSPSSKIIFDPSAIVYHKVARSRESLRYVWTRSFYEGISKAIISFNTDKSQVLSTEDSYLKFLLTAAIPSRAKRIYDLRKASELLTLVLSLSAVFAGFTTERIMKRINNEDINRHR